MHEIGSRRELFVDGLLIDRLDGASLKLQEPRPGGVAVRFGEGAGRSVESRRAFYATVLQDGGAYRMYYRGGSYGRTERGFESHTCYAESGDGVTWHKPSLGLVEAEGSTANNVILGSGWQFCPFVDTRAGVAPGERLKANARHDDGLHGYVSGDGVHWTETSPEAIVPNALSNHFDSQNAMFWSEAEGQYVLYARHNEGGNRAMARSTSPDFAAWSGPTLMSYSDTGSTVPSEHLYTNQTHPYFRAPHVYVAMPGRIFFDRRTVTEEELEFAEREMDSWGGGPRDCSDGVLLTSRAGTTRYDFTFMESFVRPGIGPQNWTSRNNYPALGVVQTGPAEMSFYVHRAYGQGNAHLERMTLRLDGFSSLNAPYAGGGAVTKPFTFTGESLEINYATSAAGSIRVELQDEAGTALPGFGADECDELIGDEVARTVTWHGEGSVAALAGRPVRIRFAMRDADVYSFRFGDE